MSTHALNNPTGRNGHASIMAEADFWCPIIQDYLDHRVRLKDMPAKIRADHQVSISERSISRLIKTHNLRTVRQSRLTTAEKENAIIQATSEDPLQEWGIRLIYEELRAQSIHISRDFIEAFQKRRDPVEAQHRWSGHKRIVRKTTFSTGPNEEWCIDGHEKLRGRMGIDVWGIIDKYSRYELGLWAVPNARRNIVPVALFLQVVQEQEGLPLQITSDKGSENGAVGAIQTALRTFYAPSLSIDTMPPVRCVRSIHNITRERSWKPLWEKDLKNILDVWLNGQLEVGYRDGDPTHRELGTWLWAKVVQNRLDHAHERQAYHRIRIQRKVLLPTGGTPHDFYHNCQRYHGMNLLIKISDMADIDTLVEEYPKEEVLQFGDDAAVSLFAELYKRVTPSRLTLKNAWKVWREMLDLLEAHL